MAWKHILFCCSDPEVKRHSDKVRHILMVLARHADNYGNACWPSWATLTEETGIPRSTLARFMPEVREVLTVDAPGFRRSNCYFFPSVDDLGNRTSIGSTKVLTHGQSRPTVPDSCQQGENTPVDKSQNETSGQSQNETDGLKMGLLQSQNGTMAKSQNGTSTVPKWDPCSPKMGHEVIIEINKNNSLSLKGEGAVDNFTSEGGYTGYSAPTTKADYNLIAKWGYEVGLSWEKVREFININVRSRWRLVSPAYGVKEMLRAYCDQWKNQNSGDYVYERERRQREGC